MGKNPLPAVYKKNSLLSDYYLFPAVKESLHITDLKIMQWQGETVCHMMAGNT